jgi:CspA family cold shock protein
LRRDGYQTAYEGARIVVEVLDRPRGLAGPAHLVDGRIDSAPSRLNLPPSRTHVQVTPTSGLEKATVKWFNRIRGFGFLTQGEGTEDIFVHMETLRRYGLTELRPGQDVMVRFGDGPKGRMASEVRPVNGSSIPASH